MTDEDLMRRAFALATEHMLAGSGGPFGAVIAHDGEIVAEGWNQVTSANDPTAHAEMVAIRRACAALGHFELRDCELFTSCEPCPMCLGAAYWARVRRISFGMNRVDAAAVGFDDDFIYREIALPLADRAIPTRQLLRAEASAPFTAWARKPDKVPY